MAGWNAGVGAYGVGAGPEVTLVDGSTFSVSQADGDISGGVHGLYLFDTRVLSHFALRVRDHRVEALSVERHGPFGATFLSRAIAADGAADSPIVLLRARSVGNGLSERIEVRNYSLSPRTLELSMDVGVDFASVFDVKAGREVPARRSARTGGGGLVFPDGLDSRDGDGRDVWQVTVGSSIHPDATEGPCLCWRVDLAPGGRWSTCVEVALTIGERSFPLAHPCGVAPERAVNVSRLASWRSSVPSFTSDDPALEAAVRQAQDDLGALRIFDPDHPDRIVVAAGAPWYMTLFGRDSLLTAWMALPTERELALGVLQTLAELQGERVDPRTEEEPGRIVHEVRYDQQTTRVLGGRNAYYGTADATPLFVMLVGELARWGASREELAPFLPHVDRALEWVASYGDRDGDGYVEYRSPTEHGLRNQGWKDSWDAIRYRDGRIADPPLALAEVQAYVYAAYLARADLAACFGDAAGEAAWRARAAELAERFDRDFWLPELGWYAMALDADKRPVDALASNMGHCLWAGIVPPARAAAVAERLASPELDSGYGLRTLAATMPGFNPLSYHCGSVWPHDTAIAIAGLFRYGFDEAAGALARGLLDASGWQGGRLPELFGGFGRDEFEQPVRYPASCSPQAWASAAPLLVARGLLGLEPDVVRGLVRARHAPVGGVRRLRFDGVWLAGRLVTIEADDGEVRVSGLPGGLRLVDETLH